MTVVPKVTVDLTELKKDIPRYQRAIQVSAKQGGRQIMSEILNQPGIISYPAGTKANDPPVPYYKRGVGTETAGGNDYSSERYGSSWKIEQSGSYKTVGSNAVSYAQYLADPERQSSAMNKIGWITTKEGVNRKLKRIGEILSFWIKRNFKGI